MNNKLLWKFLFHRDIIMLIFSLVFAWMAISLAYDHLLRFKSLEKHSGVIRKTEYVITKLVDKPLFKDTTWEMRIYLNNVQDYYKAPMGRKATEFNDLFWGDTVNLFTHDKWLGLFGSDAKSIRHLERVSDKKVFLDFERTKTSRRGVFLLPFISFLVFLFWYIARSIRRIVKLKYELTLK